MLGADEADKSGVTISMQQYQQYIDSKEGHNTFEFAIINIFDTHCFHHIVPDILLQDLLKYE